MKYLLFAVLFIVVRSEECPDESQCPEGQTCCPTISGYGCCPQPDAVCCSDEVHCCPEDYICVMQFNICVKCPSAEDKHFNIKYTPLKDTIKLFKSNLCPGGQEQCPIGKTCCSLQQGVFGCCPMPDAVCCADKVHCCPNGYICDNHSGQCIRNMYNSLWHTTKIATNLKNINCPDGTQCPDGNTCCLMYSGGYGCCPYPQATCCSDQLHCCPNAMRCNLSQGTCNMGPSVLPMLKKEPSIKRNQSLRHGKYEIMDAKMLNNIICQDGSQCDDGSTCCEMAGGVYGCCPYPQAACCSDKVHCCPNGMKCDAKEGICFNELITIPWVKKTTAIKKNEPSTFQHTLVNLKEIKNVMCPDGSQCDDGNTCCEMAGGVYGCCPYPQATCCSDKVHCCPNGMKCDVKEGICFNELTTIPWVKKTTAIKKNEPSTFQHTLVNLKEIKNVMCPDGSQCDDGNTCCEMAGGVYGCCPYPQATCCSDMLHCCPNGMKCDVKKGICFNELITIPWVKKTTAIKKNEPSTFQHTLVNLKEIKNVMCPDGSQCDDGNTCCEMAGGVYGCCPYPQATCCSDKVHCCPNGMKCDVKEGICFNELTTIPWVKKTTAIKKNEPSTFQHTLVNLKIKNVMCPDGSQCDDGNTCCEMAGGVYGCCPYPQATCCSDMLHCCPNGMKCDVKKGICFNELITIPWVKKTTAIKKNEPSTFQHTLVNLKEIKNVMCPDGSQCDDGNTCCEMAGGVYGCCPYPQATCCSDMLHCCPNGMKCDVKEGICFNELTTIPWVKKTTAIKKNEPSTFQHTLVNLKEIKNVMCPDGSQCDDGNTCCEMAGGVYGCCPYPQATCCSDMLHCCPNGMKCVVKEGICFNELITIPWVKKTTAIKKNEPSTFQHTLVNLKEIKNVMCPDGSQCDDGNTCCEMAGGVYGCCPYPQATCCSDMLHCCPNDMTCDVSKGTCNKGSFAIPWIQT